MQITLPFTAGLLFSLASTALASSHRVPLGSRDHHGLTKRAPEFTPTSPGPGDVYRVGTPIPIQWEADTSGSTKWKATNVRLMTGSNLKMSQVTMVGVIDGTDASNTTLSWTAPAVNPYSAIYFFQFDHGNAQADPTWTTRFSIADADGQTTAPSQPYQPGNKDVPAIPWGTGALASGSGSDSSSDTNSSTASSNTTPATQAASSTGSTLTTPSTTSASQTSSKSSTSTPSSTTPATGAAAPAFLAKPVGMALTGAAVGLAAAFIL
ncbi:hypothetical protein CF319_g3052 [Tilletia indica]|nr:hypothetical protein CF319_g3052 [Tilletia indica]